MWVWYVLPVLTIATIFLVVSQAQWWTYVICVLGGLVAYFGGQWEYLKFHAPKLRDLESLREILVANEK